jgi:hypothetical protein
MWENVLFGLWKVQKGTSSLHREMESPSKKVAWGETKFVVTMFNHISPIGRVTLRVGEAIQQKA